jgi:hypothetical protein
MTRLVICFGVLLGLATCDASAGGWLEKQGKRLIGKAIVATAPGPTAAIVPPHVEEVLVDELPRRTRHGAENIFKDELKNTLKMVSFGLAASSDPSQKKTSTVPENPTPVPPPPANPHPVWRETIRLFTWDTARGERDGAEAEKWIACGLVIANIAAGLFGWGPLASGIPGQPPAWESPAPVAPPPMQIPNIPPVAPPAPVTPPASIPPLS